jgi:hypothetical protein
MSDKTYINGIWCKEISFNNGGSKINASVKLDKFIEELKTHENNGWVNLEIVKRRNPDEKGNTHYVALNNWKPKNDNSNESDIF